LKKFAIKTTRSNLHADGLMPEVKLTPRGLRQVESAGLPVGSQNAPFGG